MVFIKFRARKPRGLQPRGGMAPPFLSLTLVLYIVLNSFLAYVPDAGNEVTLGPEYLVAAPVEMSKRVGVMLPDAVRGFLLQPPDDLQGR